MSDRLDGEVAHIEWPDAINGWEKHPSPDIWRGVTYTDPIDQDEIPSSRRSIVVRESRTDDHDWRVGRTDTVSDDISHVCATTLEEAKEAIREWMDEHPCKQRTLITDGGVDQSEAELQHKEVFADKYECPECDFRVEVADYGHRTRRQYEAPGIRCLNCTEDGVSLAMVRKE